MLAQAQSVLMILGPYRALLQPVQGQGRGHAYAGAVDLSGLRFDCLETGELAEAGEDVEVEVAARRVVTDGGVIAEQVRRGDFFDMRIVRVRHSERRTQPSTFSAVARMKKSRSSVARTSP